MVKELEEDRLKPFLKKSFIGWFLPLTNNSRRRHVTDMNGYNRPLAADDDEIFFVTFNINLTIFKQLLEKLSLGSVRIKYLKIWQFVNLNTWLSGFSRNDGKLVLKHDFWNFSFLLWYKQKKKFYQRFFNLGNMVFWIFFKLNWNWNINLEKNSLTL